MSLHKLSAGSGYTYLTRQVAAHDATHAVHRDGLAAYYEERGESPGRWFGSGLSALGIEVGSIVTEDQMRSLFAHGLHPNADRIAGELYRTGADFGTIESAVRLGKPFPLAREQSALSVAVDEAVRAANEASGISPDTQPPAETLARIRTEVATRMFHDRYGRAPQSATEFTTFIADSSRVSSPAVAGYDLTFSPVKSVSVLWALAPMDVAAEVRAAHDAAVANVMRWLEQEAIFTRQGRNGCRQVDTRGLIAAAFTHRDNRNGDPDLHTHVAISNKVQATDGSWLSIDGRVLHAAAVAASERYNTRIEAELRRRLGVVFVERPGTDPEKRAVREIDGIDPALIAMWSSRRACIEERQAELSRRFLVEHGRPPTPIESVALAQQATLETRRAKHEPRSEHEQRAAWRGQAQHGRLSSEVTAVLRRATTAREALSSDSISDLAKRVIRTVSDKRATWRRWNVLAEAERLVRQADLDPARVDHDVAAVASHAIEESSVAIGTADTTPVPDTLRRRDGASVFTTAGTQLYTSERVLNAEQKLIEIARETGAPAVTPEAVELAALEATANGLTLNAGQVEMVKALVTTGEALAVAIAPAGSGKTTALRVAARAWQEHGGRVLGLAPSAAAAKVLGDAIGTQSETIAKYLHELDVWLARPSIEERVANPMPAWVDRLKNTLVVIDEAGMAATKDLHRIAHTVTRLGGVVRLVGDDRQLASVAAGGILRDIVEQRGAATLDTLVRFADPAEAKATLEIRRGDVTAIEHYLTHGRVHVGDRTTVLDAALDAWAADLDSGRKAVLLAGTRRQVRELNLLARSRRLESAVDAPGPVVQLRDDCPAGAGDPIISTRNCRDLRITATDWVKNGDHFTIDHVAEDGSLQVRHDPTGRSLTLPPDYVTKHVTLGYATTIHRAQGTTAEVSHTVIGGTETRQQLYVALSRGRDANHLHVTLPAGPDDHPGLDRDALTVRSARNVLERVLSSDGSQRSATSTAADVLPLRDQLRQAINNYLDVVEQCGLPAGPGQPPVPWVPPVPRTDDPQLARYLQGRADHITDLTRQIGDEALHDAPFETDTGVLAQHDPELLRERAVWEALYVRTPWESKAPRPSDAAAAYGRELATRLAPTRKLPDRPELRWKPIVDAINPDIAKSADWPELAEQVDFWTRGRLNEDVIPILEQAVRNVPTDLPNFTAHIQHRFEHLIDRGIREAHREAARERARNPYAIGYDYGRSYEHSYEVGRTL